MKGKQSQKRVNPTPMITTITEIFNPILTKPAFDTNNHSHNII